MRTSRALAPPQPGTAPPRYCGRLRVGPRRLNGISVEIAEIAPLLSRTLGRLVIDKTGLTGKFDVRLEYTSDDSQLAAMAVPGEPPPRAADSRGPSIFTAIQEQLGLKLESQKGPVETFVIDRIEKPSEN